MTDNDEQPLLPDLTVDETDVGWHDEDSDDLRRLLDDRPPHYDRPD